MTKLLFTASAFLALSSPAFAATPDTQSVEVSTAGLDMNSATGRARLKARVGRAADRVCGANDARSYDAHRAYQQCRTAAMRDALGQ